MFEERRSLETEELCQAGERDGALFEQAKAVKILGLMRARDGKATRV